MSQSQSQRRLISRDQAATYAQVTERTIRNWIGKGHLIGYRVGSRHVMVDLDELAQMLRTAPALRVRSGRYAFGKQAQIVQVALPAAKDEASK